METNEIAHWFLMYSRTTEMYLGSHYSGAVCECSSAELSTQMFSAGNAARSWEKVCVCTVIGLVFMGCLILDYVDYNLMLLLGQQC